VIEAFCDAVGKFAEDDHPLRYSWLDFLPRKPVGQALYDSIIASLQSRWIVQTRNKRLFKLPHAVRQVPNLATHGGEPLFEDLTDEYYIASEYASRHRQSLLDLGVFDLSWNDLLDLLQADLSRGSELSRLKRTPSDDPWHRSFANAFLPMLSFGAPQSTVKRLKTLAIIPLVRKNQWSGAPGYTKGAPKHVYFSFTNKVPVPHSVSLNLLNIFASSDNERKAFYKALGVEECPKKVVFAKIEDAHRMNIRRPVLEDPRFAELRYLYHYHKNPEELKSWVRLPVDGTFLEDEDTSKPWYFPSETEYDLYQLIPASKKRNVREVAIFLPQALLDFVAPTVSVRGKTWTAWLGELTDARNYPTLCERQDATLSFGLLAVLQYNPSMFLGTLKAHWGIYQHAADAVRADLQKRQILCRSGTTSSLQSTYLPTTAVLTMISQLNLPEKTFPILKIPGGNLTDVTYREWQFLEHFGVQSKPDLEFFKTALEYLADTDPVSFIDLLDIYRSIALMATIEDYEDLRYDTTFDDNFRLLTLFSDFFGEGSCIYAGSKEMFLPSSSCIWSGPEFLQCTTVLEVEGYSGDPHVQHLFTKILEIGDWCITHIIEDLEQFRDDEETLSFDQAQQYYEYLEKNVEDAELDTLK